MVAEDLLKIYHKFKGIRGFHDFADKFNYLYTSAVLLTLTMMTSTKTYFFAAITCLCVNPPKINSGEFRSFAENFCWINGTIPLMNDEKISTHPKDWISDRKLKGLDYYQWVPLFFSIQCILFNFPRIIWHLLIRFTMNYNLQAISQLTHKASKCVKKDERTEIIEHVAEILQNQFQKKRSLAVTNRLTTFLNNFFQKKSLFISYIFVKTLYVLNCWLQFFLVYKFLQLERFFNQSTDSALFLTLPIRIIEKLIRQPYILKDNIFPRVSYCIIPIREVSNVNHYVAQCALPINMLNEKLFLFLVLWLVLCLIVSLYSVMAWIAQVIMYYFQKRFLISHLEQGQKIQREKNNECENFINSYQIDGLFLLKMIKSNSGGSFCCSLIESLWTKIHSENERSISKKTEEIALVFDKRKSDGNCLRSNLVANQNFHSVQDIQYNHAAQNPTIQCAPDYNYNFSNMQMPYQKSHN